MSTRQCPHCESGATMRVSQTEGSRTITITRVCSECQTMVEVEYAEPRITHVEQLGGDDDE